jgi:hypothetical protein
VGVLLRVRPALFRAQSCTAQLVHSSQSCSCSRARVTRFRSTGCCRRTLVALPPNSDSHGPRDEQRDPLVTATGAPRSPFLRISGVAGRQPTGRSAARDRGCYLPREVFFGRLGFAGAFFTVWASDFGRFLPATPDSFPIDALPSAPYRASPALCPGSASAWPRFTPWPSTPTCWRPVGANRTVRAPIGLRAGAERAGGSVCAADVAEWRKCDREPPGAHLPSLACASRSILRTVPESRPRLWPRLAASVGSTSDSGLAGDLAHRGAAGACARPQLDADPLLLALRLNRPRTPSLYPVVWTRQREDDFRRPQFRAPAAPPLLFVARALS